MEREAKKIGITINAFRGDNGVFKADEFKVDINNLD